MDAIFAQMQSVINSQAKTIEELKAEIERLKGPKPKKALTPQQQLLKEIKEADKEVKKAEAASAKQVKKAEIERNKAIEKALKLNQKTQKEAEAIANKLVPPNEPSDVFVDALQD
jgi:hypothetical protein